MDYLNFDKNHDWMGVDFDGTLHDRSTAVDLNNLGKPVPEMLSLVKQWLAEGMQVRLLTARVADVQKNMPEGMTIEDFKSHQIKILNEWCLQYIGQILPITCSKDAYMYRLYDDRAVAIERNTGRILGENAMW